MTNGSAPGRARLPAPSGREDVGRQPALVDLALDDGRVVDPGELPEIWFAVGHRPLARSVPSRRISAKKRPARPADERVVVPPAGSTLGTLGSSRSPRPAILSARYRAPPARLAGDVRVHGPVRLAPLPDSLLGPAWTLLFPVLAVSRECSTRAPRRLRAGRAASWAACTRSSGTAVDSQSSARRGEPSGVQRRSRAGRADRAEPRWPPSAGPTRADPPEARPLP